MPAKLSAFIVDKRKPIFFVFILLAAISLFTVSRVNINYDFTSYLGKDTETRKSLELMNNEFGKTETISIMLTDSDAATARALLDEISKMSEVIAVTYDEQSDVKYFEGLRRDRITIYLGDTDAVEFYRSLVDKLDAAQGMPKYDMSGTAAQTVDLEERIGREIPLAMLIAVIVVLAVLLLTSHSYFEPFVFVIVLLVSILINMGTNFIFGTISFITFAVCAILQLALAMDYGIMLLHTFFEIRQNENDDKTAMRLALERTFMPISSSALTTVSGLVSLMFMSFTIGFDIGIVLSKGILITMISVFTFMPSIILMFSKPLVRTLHKPLPLGGNALGSFTAKTAVRIATPIILIGAIILAAILQNKVVYTFSDAESTTHANPVYQVYGASNSVAILLPCDGKKDDFELQREFIREAEALTIENRPAVTNALSIVTAGEAAIKRFSPEEAYSVLLSFLPEGRNLPVTQEAFKGLLVNSGFEDGITAEELVNLAEDMGGMLKTLKYVTDDELSLISEAREKIALAKRLFLSESYSRVILTLDAPLQGEDSERLINELISSMRRLYPDRQTGITGFMMSVYDISHAFSADLTKVNLITVFAIFLIVLVSFRSLMIPVILILAIQGAVWINFALAVPASRTVFFMCYLICLAIQMGATIDYGILLTSNYVRLRAGGLQKSHAIKEAMRMSMPTILTSGLILFGAGLAIGKACTVYYIYSIGLLIASGAVFSLAMVLLLLPTMLINCDGFIMKEKQIIEKIRKSKQRSA